MKTKILLIALGIILSVGAATHIGNTHECPFDKPCQKLFKSETSVVKSEKTAATHIGNTHECPFDKPCQNLFKSETSAVKSEKTVDLAKTETGMLAK